MLNPGGELIRDVSEAVRQAERTGRTQWLVARREVSARDALELFASRAEPDGFYWEQPTLGVQIATGGVAHRIEVEGADRFERVAQQVRGLLGDLRLPRDDPEQPREPLLFGGFAFADAPHEHETRRVWHGFPAGRLLLPRWSFVRRGKRASLRCARGIAPGEAAPAVAEAMESEFAKLSSRSACGGRADRSGHSFRAEADAAHEDFRARVAAALEAIAQGEFEKVVLARSVRLERPGGFAAAGVLANLRARHPDCTSFAVAQADAAFVGATPELLLELQQDRVRASALAGSAARGRSPEEDARLGVELLESKKEQSEHAVVVRALREALTPLCREIAQREAPGLKRLAGIQHLHTPFEGRLREQRHLLELLPRLHPTPAVGGAPRRSALAWLSRNEGLERGWYAGPIGFVDAAGGGELRVALRCALLREDTAHLFAGGGIVGGSEPQTELRETQLKLAAMLGSLVEL